MAEFSFSTFAYNENEILGASKREIEQVPMGLYISRELTVLSNSSECVIFINKRPVKHIIEFVKQRLVVILPQNSANAEVQLRISQIERVTAALPPFVMEWIESGIRAAKAYEEDAFLLLEHEHSAVDAAMYDTLVQFTDIEKQIRCMAFVRAEDYDTFARIVYRFGQTCINQTTTTKRGGNLKVAEVKAQVSANADQVCYYTQEALQKLESVVEKPKFVKEAIRACKSIFEAFSEQKAPTLEMLTEVATVCVEFFPGSEVSTYFAEMCKIGKPPTAEV